MPNTVSKNLPSSCAYHLRSYGEHPYKTYPTLRLLSFVGDTGYLGEIITSSLQNTEGSEQLLRAVKSFFKTLEHLAEGVEISQPVNRRILATPKYDPSSPVGQIIEGFKEKHSNKFNVIRHHDLLQYCCGCWHCDLKEGHTGGGRRSVVDSGQAVYADNFLEEHGF